MQLLTLSIFCTASVIHHPGLNLCFVTGKEQVEELNLANGSPPTSPRHDMDSPMLPSAVVEEVTPTLRSCVFNRTFMFHLFWFVVNDFYLLTFIGVSNAMLERVLQRDTGKGELICLKVLIIREY